MADVQHARYGRLVQALFGLKQALTLGQALPDVQPSIDLERPRAEMEAYGGQHLAAGYGLGTAVAGQNAVCSLVLPSGCGMLFTLEKIIISVAASTNVAIAPVSTTFGTGFGAASTNLAFRDTRKIAQGNAALPAAQIRAGASATGIGSILLPAVTVFPGQYEINCDFVAIDPRNLGVGAAVGWGVQNVTANSAMTVGFVWRERRAEPQELVLL